jgi:hypothetical protein
MDRADVVAVPGSCVAKESRKPWVVTFRQTRVDSRLEDRFTDHRFIQVMSVIHSGSRINIMQGRGKYPLPSPFPISGGEPVNECVQQGGATVATREVVVALTLCIRELHEQLVMQRSRESRLAILVSLLFMHHHFARGDTETVESQL